MAAAGLRPYLFKLYEKSQLTIDDLVPSGADAASIRSAEPFWAEVVKAVIDASRDGDSREEVGGLAKARFLSWCLTHMMASTSAVALGHEYCCTSSALESL